VEIIYGGPLYPSEQIANWLRARIIAGEFAANEAIPPESAIVQETGSARTTVRRAIKILRDEGWVYTLQAKGTFVSPDRPPGPPG
jgi:GntR family transcriptional regulator